MSLRNLSLPLWDEKKRNKALSKPIKSTNIISGQMFNITLENKMFPDKN